MSGVWGNNVKFSIFGESHGKGIGIVISGLPAGIKLDIEEIEKEMTRRAPGNSELATPRKEKDSFEIISGYFNEYTTGAPLCAMIWNTNTKSKDYDLLKSVMRPGHSDFTGKIKYKGFNDHRGGGHFSGRLTAPIVFSGAVAKQIVKSLGVKIASHIYSVSHIYDEPFTPCEITDSTIDSIYSAELPVINRERIMEIKNVINNARAEGDSVGGIVEAAILNLPEGIGDPFFDSIESRLSHLLFSIPAVKAVEFGAGFSITKMMGSEANDPMYIEDSVIKTSSNNNGGVIGGISNGMPVIFRCGIKPTPSISSTQKTVNIDTLEAVDINVVGRHDPCIVIRALPVIEAAAAMCVLDFTVNSFK